MVDETAALLAGVDAARAVPSPMRERLHEAISANTLAPEPENFGRMLSGPRRLPRDMRDRLAATLLETDQDIATVMIGIDDPRALPPDTAHRIEGSLLRNHSMRRAYQVFGVAAAAVLIVAGAVFLAVRNDHGSSGVNPQIALPTISTSVAPPATTLQPSPTTSVLGMKSVRPVPAPATAPAKDSNGIAPQTATIGEPVAAPETAGGPAFAPLGRESAASSGSGNGANILDSVTGLVNNLLRDLGLSQGGSGSVHSLPVDDSSLFAHVPAPATTAPASTTPRAKKPQPSATTAPRSASRTETVARIVLVPIAPERAHDATPAAPALLDVSVAGINISL